MVVGVERFLTNTALLGSNSVVQLDMIIQSLLFEELEITPRTLYRDLQVRVLGHFRYDSVLLGLTVLGRVLRRRLALLQQLAAGGHPLAHRWRRPVELRQDRLGWLALLAGGCGCCRLNCGDARVRVETRSGSVMVRSI